MDTSPPSSLLFVTPLALGVGKCAEDFGAANFACAANSHSGDAHQGIVLKSTDARQLLLQAVDVTVVEVSLV